ncbi:MAG: type II toxin-antitoxin system Phd/YefM family antitoxin [Flexilinea sp.]|nr:type II toxin-antitoxin system Phd/YefM family antitoxin [Flexilinea sp.]
MTQVNVLEAKNQLSRLIHMLEAGEEDQIIISRNGDPVAQLTLLQKPHKKPIFGVAKGEFTYPDDIHYLDDEIADLFYGDL